MSASITEHLVPAARFGAVMVLLCGLVYPLGTTVLAQALFPDAATGSIIEVDNRRVGSRLVAQPFVSDVYLHGRPSACGHDPRGLAGSNLAPSNGDLRQRVAKDVAALVAREGIAAGEIPPDLVAASGSCIDPEVSLDAALIQATRIAAARGWEVDAVEQVLRQAATARGPLDIGPPRVNVLEANLTLDRLRPTDAR